MIEIFKNWNKQILAFVFAFVFIFISTCLFYNMGFKNGINEGKLSTNAVKKLIKEANLNDSLKNINDGLKISVQDEKISSIHSRFNDLYLFGGMILALLGIILVSVYIKSENDVEKHMQKNFNKHKEDIENEVNTARSLVSQIQSELQLAKETNKSRRSQHNNDSSPQTGSIEDN